MFVGRDHEINVLNRLYGRKEFTMTVVYGRRRVGKTALLDEFSRDKPTLFFTAQQKSDVINLRSFSQTVYRFFGIPESTGAFASWEEALRFVAHNARGSDPLVFVFDEFPYAAQAQPSLPSALQIVLDHDFQKTNVCMILCGSNEGFMESEVLGAKSPLYGRRSAQIKVQPFDYLDAALMMPERPPVERIQLYAMFGGTPYYLEQIDRAETVQQNVARLFFDIAGVLYAEPQMLLRQELREPTLYSSVLDAVAGGATTPKVAAERAGVDGNSIGKYLSTLVSLGLVERVVPFGEGTRSRKGIYRIKDPFFSFWYRFVSPYVGAIEAGAGRAVAQKVCGQAFETYVGKQFESICLQWVMRQNAAGGLPLLASSFGSWWGTDPSIREQADIDIVAADPTSKTILLGECKWRESFNESEAMETLMRRGDLIKGYDTRHYLLFTKHPVSRGTDEKIERLDGFSAVSAEQLYEE